MPNSATFLPCRRSELVVRPLGDNRPFVVKDPCSGAYYQLGDEEHFLLMQLDGRRDAEAIRNAFAEQFGKRLDDEELEAFLELARSQEFLQEASAASVPRLGIPDPNAAPLRLRILYWRKS